MPDVIGDPEKLRQLARTLSKSADQLEQIGRQMQRGLALTGSERQRFEQDFKPTLKALTQVVDHLRSQHVPQLNKKAEALERVRR